MTHYDPGDVVLVRFPFTDLSTLKKRPAVVLSPREYLARSGDVVLLALTSQKQPEGELALQCWQESGLAKPTWFKPLIATVAVSVVERRLGTLCEEDRKRAVSALRLLLSASFVPSSTQ